VYLIRGFVDCPTNEIQEKRFHSNCFSGKFKGTLLTSCTWQTLWDTGIWWGTAAAHNGGSCCHLVEGPVTVKHRKITVMQQHCDQDMFFIFLMKARNVSIGHGCPY